MTNQLGNHAIVIGAGIAGLTAAKVLSDYFKRVTILDRDDLPIGSETRTGTPHCKQAHTLLRGGLDALASFFPDFEAELERAGAVRTRSAKDILVETPGLDPWPRRDFDFDTLCMTRPLVEFVIRRLIARHSNVEIRSLCRVRRLEPSHAGSVAGVTYDHKNGQSISLKGEMVVDASSLGLLTLSLLDEIGIARPDETTIDVDIGYATAFFKVDGDTAHDWQGVIHRPARDSGRGGFLFPVENNQWQVSLCGIHGDHPPNDFEGFVEFAKSMRTRTIYEAIAKARPVSPIHRYVFPSSVRRRFETMTSFPDGLLPVGDVICRFNPAFGQGMSVAAQQMAVLKRLLEERASRRLSLASLTLDFFAAVQDVLVAPWSVAETDFAYEKTQGQRPDNFEQRLLFGGALQKLAAADPEVHLLMTQVNHLMKPPTCLREPAILKKLSLATTSPT